MNPAATTDPAGADSVSFEIVEGIARVAIANPGKRNSFTWRMYDELLLATNELSELDGLVAVVFRGSAEDGFAAGTDIRQFTDFASGTDGLEYERRIGRVLAAVAAIRVPTIALVEGAAVGAGLAIAAMCDLVIAERGAVFGAPIARTLGNCLPISVVAQLRSRMGASRALAMLLTATLMPADELVASGFVFRLVEPGGLEDAAREVLRRISTSAPLTVRALKEMNRRLDLAEVLPDDEDLLELCYGSADFHEGVRAFLEQRHANWEGR